VNTNIHPVMVQALKGFMPPVSKRLSADFDTTIAGIPCGIKTGKVTVQKPLGPNCDSDWDCYGFTDVEFTVLDSKGYPAPWLEAKMTDADRQNIESEILDQAEEA